MKRTRTLSPILGLSALSAFGFAAAPARAQTITKTNLNPTTGFYGTLAAGVSGDLQVGNGLVYTSDYYPHALLWHGKAGNVLDIHPDTLFNSTRALGVSGSVQVGYGYNYNYDTGDTTDLHALLWHGTPDSVTDLNPAPTLYSEAVAVAGNTQVGEAHIIDGSGNFYEPFNHAFLWHGTAASAVDLHPDGFDFSFAHGIFDDVQVGEGKGIATGNSTHALLWHGTSGSVIDLHPAGFASSIAFSAADGVQAGGGNAGTSTAYVGHALLWHGTAASAVDLNPKGFVTSCAYGASGSVQVGTGTTRTTGSRGHALLWQGTADSVIDLGEGSATGVSGSGNVYDVVGVSAGTNAVLWHVVLGKSPRPVVEHLYPASRTEGEKGFTLTVTGTGYTSKSVVQWNGQAQTTGFDTSNRLAAQIPAALLVHAGTAKITVITPNGGTSNVHLETIMPRPLLTDLSPASKPAGSGTFTLTVTGTGFRPASFYAPSVVKWNGAELATAYVSATKLTAQVPASLLTKSGKATVTVTTPQVATSSGKTFTIAP